MFTLDAGALKPFYPPYLKVFGFLNLFSKRFKPPEDIFFDLYYTKSGCCVCAHAPIFLFFLFLINHSKDKDVIYLVRAKRKYLPKAELSQSG